MRTSLLVVPLAALVAVSLPSLAYAQDAPRSPGLKGGEVQRGFVVAPDVRFTEVADRSATLAGAYGGWMTNRRLLIGGAGYWLTNREDDFKVQYAGGLVRWGLAGQNKRFGLSTGALVGVGRATISQRLAVPVGEPDGEGASESSDPDEWRDGDTGPGFARNIRGFDDTFFVAEPQVSMLVGVTRWMRIDVGAGYRLIAAGHLGTMLRGASGSIAIQLGGR